MKKEAKGLFLNVTEWQNKELKRLAKEANLSVTAYVVQKTIGERNQLSLHNLEAKKRIEKENKAGEILESIIFLRTVKGAKFSEIANYLNEKGYTTKQGKPFTTDYVRKLNQVANSAMYSNSTVWHI